METVHQSGNESIIGRASLQRDRDSLAEDNQRLVIERDQLKKEKEQIAKERDEWKVKHGQLQPHVQAVQQNLAAAYHGLSSQFQAVSQASLRRERAPNQTTTLAQTFNGYKQDYEAMLQQEIDSLPQNDPAIIPRRRLLEYSQRDRNIVENVIEELSFQERLLFPQNNVVH